VRFVFVVLALWLAAAALGASSTPREIRLDARADVTVEIHSASGRDLLIWLPSGFNLGAHETRLADELAERGIEVWRADLIEGRFLTPVETSLEDVPAADVVTLIAAAHRATGKRVFLAGVARGGLLALRGAHEWLRAHPDSKTLGGVVLLHPNLYVGTPEPGKEADYHPVVPRTRVPVFLIQSENSPWRWRLADTQKALATDGAPVFVRLIPEVRDRFYFRPDATGIEERSARKLATQMREAVVLMGAATIAPTRTVANREISAGIKTQRVRELRPYRADPTPPALSLPTLAGPRTDLAALRGRVVLLNFWASWCPPCVHEMPSMQRLKAKLRGKPFTILAVNMGEDRPTIETFLKEKVSVDFPILLDTDGAALKRWKVFAFPTSYLVGADGRIRYGAYGELTWDSAEVIGVVESLLPAAARQ